MNALRLYSRVIFQRSYKLNFLNNTEKRHISRHVMPVLSEITRRKKEITKNTFEKKIESRSGFLEWNFDAEIYAFNARLNEKFNLDLLTKAFTHYSYILKEEQSQRQLGIVDPKFDMDNNRNFIEDGRILTSTIIKSYLGAALPHAPVECILALHDHLMSNETLAHSSSLIGTKDIILTEEYPPTIKTLANTFLALVSALAQSVNDIHAGIFVRDFLITTLAEKDLNEIWNPNNPIEILNDILVRDNRQPIEPRLITKCGINTLLPVYNVGLYSNKQFISSGTECNIEDATRVAALNALLDMFKMSSTSYPMKFNFTIDPASEQINNLPLEKWCQNNVQKLTESN